MFSYVALERITTDNVKENPRLRRVLEKSGRPFRSDAGELSDESILEKLESIGVILDRSGVEKMSQSFPSAEAAAASVYKTTENEGRWDSDWAWIGIDTLWQRWFPDQPGFEMLDDSIRAGYDVQHDDEEQCCREWRRSSDMVGSLARQFKWKALNEFDDAFKGSQSVFNWIQDYSMYLEGCHRYDEHIEVFQKFQNWLAPEDHGLIEHDLATCWIRTGKVAKGEAIFSRIAKNKPDSCSTWINWANAWSWKMSPDAEDFAKAEEILKKGLKQQQLDDPEFAVEILKQLYERQDKNPSEVDDLYTPKTKTKSELTVGPNTLSSRGTKTFGGKGVPLSALDNSRNEALAEINVQGSKKTGRNEPCPCGSGKKFKKCCG